MNGRAPVAHPCVMGVLFGDGTANFVVTVSSIFLLTRFAVPAKLLTGVKIFKALPHNPETDGKDKSPSPGKGGKKERKMARAAARQQILVEGAEQMVRFKLPSKSVEGAHYYHDFEVVVMIGAAVVTNFILAASPLPGLKVANHKWPIWLALLYPFATAWAVTQAELLTKAAMWKDKAFLAGLCVLTTIGAFCMLDRMPPSTFDFQWTHASREFGWTITTMLRKLTFSADVPEVKVPGELLKIILGVTAGLLSGLIAPGAVRVAKCLMLALSPPPATCQYISTPAVSAAVMQLAAALPVVGALFWVRPMVQELLGWSDASVQIFRAFFMLLLASVQLLAVRPYLQAYLNTGLVEWWTHKHSITSANPSPRVGEFIRMKVDFVNILVCKVGLELVAPAAIWLTCSSLLLYSIFKEGTQPEGWTRYKWPFYLDVRSPEELPWMPTKLLTFAAGFLGWWTCCCWFGFTAVVLCMHRFGLLTT